MVHDSAGVPRNAGHSAYPGTARPTAQAPRPSQPAHHPGQAGLSPSQAGLSPSYPGHNPGHPGRSPGHPGQNPGHPGQNPGHPGQNPGHPAHTSQNPGRSAGHPGRNPGYPGFANQPQNPQNPPRSWPIPDGPTEPLNAPAADRPQTNTQIANNPEPQTTSKNNEKNETSENNQNHKANKKPKHRNATATIALLISLLALLITTGSSYLTWKTLTSPAQPDRPITPENYPAKYAKEPLNITAGCPSTLFLDLNEPRVNTPEGTADLRYESRCADDPPRLTLGPGATGASRQENADTDAAGCARAIRTSPITPGADVDVKKGTVLCVLTRGGADDPAVLSLVEIIDVGGTGTAGLRATSWEVPA
jgi:hypothetical protein